MKQSVTTYIKKGVNWIAGCLIAFGILFVMSVPSQNARRAEAKALLLAQQEAAHASLATACVLALPVDENGRDERQVQACFTQYGLEAPNVPGGTDR